MRGLTAPHQPLVTDPANDFGGQALVRDHRLVWPELKIATNAFRTSTETCRIAWAALAPMRVP